MKNKQGITLLILIVTIILILILVSTITMISGNSVNNSRIVAFANDLNEIEDLVKVYYMQNDKLPTADEKVYKKEEIANIVPSKYKGKFLEELQANSDDKNTSFYKVDLTKLEVEQSIRGLQKDENGNLFESDVYVVAYPSMNIYYLEGLRAKNGIFFSITSKITSLTKIVVKDTVESGATSITTSNGIIVRKQNSNWSNKLDIIIETNMSGSEQLFFEIVDGIRHEINTVNGQNVLKLSNDFFTIFSNTTGQTQNTGVNLDELSTFNSKDSSNKKIIITKQLDGNVIGRVIVSLENYETDKPGFSGNINVSIKEDYNLISLNSIDSTSGISEVRYEYITRIDDDGNIVLYYEGINNFDEKYMKSRGKKATISSDGFVEIKLPKDIESIQINAFDKAGNISDTITQRIVPEVYIDINGKDATKTSVDLENLVRLNQNIDINSATIQISTDGVNYTSGEQINFTHYKDNIYKCSVNCEDLVDVNDKIYIKLNVNYGENKTETRIKEIEIDTVKK